MFRIGVITLFFFIVIACSNQEDPAVTKKEEPQEEQNSPKLIEEEGENNEEDTLSIEFSLMDEQVSINASQIGILRSYLEASENQTEELENMTLKRIAELEDKSIYLLEFACIDGACSYLLLAQGDQSSSFLAEDLARFKLAKVSPDNQHLLMIFSRERLYEGVQLVQDKLVVLDVQAWQTINFDSNSDSHPLSDYAWPILHAEWKSETSIGLTVPNIEAPEEDLLTQWNNSNRNTKNIEVSVVPDIP